MIVEQIIVFFIILTSFFCSSQIIKIPLIRIHKEKDLKQHDFKITEFIETDSSESDPILNPNNSYQTFTHIGNIKVGTGQKSFKVAFTTGEGYISLATTELSQNTTYNQLFKNGYDCQHTDGCDIQSIPPPHTYPYRDYPYLTVATINSFLVGGLQPTSVNLSLIREFTRQPINPLLIEGVVGIGKTECQISQGCLVYNLFKNQIIKEDMFSLYFGQDYDDNELILGGFNKKKITDTSQIYYHSCDNDLAWSVRLKKFQFSTLTRDYQQLTSTVDNQIYIDSGINYIILSSDLYQNFQQFLNQKYVVSFDKQNNTFINCSSDLPDLEFTLTDIDGVDRIYTIPKSNYLYDLGDSKCFIMVKTTNEDLRQGPGDFQRLGVPFLKRYVSIFSHQDSQQKSTIGFSLSNTSNSTSWIIYPIIISCILIVGIISYYLYRYIKRKKQQNKTEITQIISNSDQPESKMNDSSFSSDDDLSKKFEDIHNNKEISIPVKYIPPNIDDIALNIDEQKQKVKTSKNKQLYKRTF